MLSVTSGYTVGVRNKPGYFPFSPSSPPLSPPPSHPPDLTCTFSRRSMEPLTQPIKECYQHCRGHLQSAPEVSWIYCDACYLSPFSCGIFHFPIFPSFIFSCPLVLPFFYALFMFPLHLSPYKKKKRDEPHIVQ